MRVRFALLAALGICACGGVPQDLRTGTFSFDMMGRDTDTMPVATTQTVMGNVSVTTARTVEYLVTLAQNDIPPCVLSASPNATKDSIVIGAGQKCTFNYWRGPVTVTLSGGTLTASDDGATLQVDYAYESHFTVTLGYGQPSMDVPFAGTGTRTFTAARR